MYPIDEEDRDTALLESVKALWPVLRPLWRREAF
jgi:hypothetical protein